MAAVPTASDQVLAVWWRQFLVWRRLMRPSLATNVLEPILILFAFGLGLGGAIPTMGGLDYIAFVLPGIACYSVMFAASFETTIGAFTRFQTQKTWDAILSSPVRLIELVTGETVWAVFKGLISAVCVLTVGALWGGVNWLPGAFLAIPTLLLGAFTFGACGLLATAMARDYMFFSYFFTFWVTPMFVFSGVFFDIRRFPLPVEAVSWLFPMTHLIAVVRPLTAGQSLALLPTLGHLAYVAVLGVVAFRFAYRRLARRLFD